MADRIATYADFWPYYISEHRKPVCRYVHFVGTSGFLATFLGCLVDRPLPVGVAGVLIVAAGWAFFGMEGRRSAVWVLLGMIALMAAAHPTILAGVVFAYACAWVGHFLVEHNRPATFTYPLWSLASDFRMLGEMLRGRLWSGDGSEIAGPPEAAPA